MDYVVRQRVCCCLGHQALGRHSLVRTTGIYGMLFSYVILLVYFVWSCQEIHSLLLFARESEQQS